MSDEDPDFLKYIHKKWIVTPSNNKRNFSYNQQKKHFSQIGQSKLVDKVRIINISIQFSYKS